MRAGPDDLEYMRHSDDVAAERDQERRDRLAEQLERDHIEGMADERVEQERREFRYDFEGWTADDRLIVHIAGMGTLRIPQETVADLGRALLAEHEIHTRGWG